MVLQINACWSVTDEFKGRQFGAITAFVPRSCRSGDLKFIVEIPAFPKMAKHPVVFV